MLIGARTTMFSGEKWWGLQFKAEQAGSTISINKQGSPYQIGLEYCINFGKWNEFTPAETVITLAKIGDVAWIRSRKVGNNTIGKDSSSYYYFSMTGKISASGSIMSMLTRKSQIKYTVNYIFYNLFQNCSSLVSAPELPALTVN